MAASVNRLGYLALRYTSRIPSRKGDLPLILPSRALHTTKFYRRNDDPEPSAETKPFDFLSSLDPEGRTYYDTLLPEEKIKFEQVAHKLDEHMTSPEVVSDLNAQTSQAAYDSQALMKSMESLELPEQIKPGLFSMGEVDPQDTGEDEEFDGDDISSIAHGQLEQHREFREYARIAAWEMPLLTKLAKPFEPPTKDQPLRFRYTTYMGESHPAANKIVLEFCTRDLPGLTEAQRIKLIKLVGVRYNPETDVVKMSSEMFETQAQNKRYLGDLVDTLMAEAKDSTDMYEDIPLDFRHHKYKSKPVFPEEWKLTPERKKQLEAERQQKRLGERQREQLDQLPDGVKVIEAMLKAKPMREEARVLVQAPGRSTGNAKKLRM